MKEQLERAESLCRRINALWPDKEVTVKRMIERAVNYYLNKKEQDIYWKEWRNKNFNFIYKRDKGRCYYSGVRLSKKEATLDHMTPLNRGGKNELSNVVLASAECNEEKGNLTAEEYKLLKKQNIL